MKKAKMKVLSFILAACMMFTMLPVNVMATETVSGGDVKTTVSTGDVLTTTNTVQSTVSDGDAGTVKNDKSEVIAVSGITLDQDTLEVGVGAEPITLTATVLPENATDKSVDWTSSEPGVASVEDGVVTFGYMGEAVITATAGEYSASCAVTVGEGEWGTYESDIVVIAASDYQDSNSSSTMQTIMNKIKETYSSVYGILMGGDYDAGDIYPTASHITAVNTTINSVFSSIAEDNRIFIQGNHETYGNLSPDGSNLLDTTGAHDTDYYGVYAINYEDFDSASSGLKTYLDNKSGEAPIFVMSHQPLHVTSRGDNSAATNLFDVLNSYTDLNIIFLFGHNHSGGYDAYLGNGSIYLKKGDSITVAGGSTETLNFTYMNYGYVGYVNGSADTTLTMTAFKISDNEVVIQRYDANGLHNLKAAGTAVSGYNTDTNVYGTAVLSLTDGTSTITALSEDTGSDSGSTGSTGSSSNIYTLDTDGIDAGEKYLIVSTGSDGDGSALTVSDGESVGTTVTISGSQIETDNTNLVWVLSGAESGTAYNESTGYYVYPSSTNGQDPVIRSSTCNLLFTHNGNGEYIIKRDFDYGDYYVSSSDDWAYSSSETSVYLFKKTSEGVGGSTVTPEGGDWVTISDGSGAIIYTLDEDGLNVGSDEKYLIVDTSVNGTGNVLTNSTGTASNTTVTIADKVIKVTDDSNIAWTPTGTISSANFANGNYNIYLSYNNGVLYTSTRFLVVNHNGEGEYKLKRNSNSSGYYVQYSSSDGWDTLSTTSNSVYLYRKTGTEAAGDAEYAKIQETDGTTDFTFTVSRGTSAENALAEVMEGIDVLISSDKAEYITLDDTDENITWELASAYGDGTTAGEYAVKIYYKDKLLGIARVIVPEVTIKGITVSPESGAVTVGASEAALVGATITVDVADNEGEDFTVPVTVGMLSGNFDTATAGTYEGLTVSYNGFTYENFTLTVKEKVVNNYPSYPNEGAVKVSKSATGIDFQKTGVARVELTASGVPMNQGVDVLLVLDTSSSMEEAGSLTSGTRIEVLRECVNELILNLKKDRLDGSESDIDIAIVNFNGYFDNKSVNTIGSAAKDTNTVGGLLTDGWVDIQELPDSWGTTASDIPLNSGTNYDHGLQQAYDLLTQKQADNGENTRKQFVLFMSDGAPFQYNGVSSNSVDEDWANWIMGSYTTEEVEALGLKNPEFYYGNNDGNGQKHWIAEAIKGAPADEYQIPIYSDTTSNATGELKTVPGLGATLYTIGYALETDMDKNPVDADGMATILKIIGTDGLYYPVESKEDLQETFDDFAGAVLYAAENAIFEDALGESYNIQLANSTIRTGTDGKVFTLDPAPTMEVREYTIWTRAELEDANGNLSEENAKKVGTRKTDDEGNYIYDTLEIVSFNAEGTEAYTGDDTTNIMVDGVICANTFWFNTNSSSVYIDADDDTSTGTDGKEFELKAETFLWKVGTIKTKEIALSYYVYLDESLEGDASAGSYETNQYAILSYDNYLGNPCSIETVSPQMAWLSANVSYAYYLVNKDGTPVNANGDEVTFANREVVVHPTKYDEIKLNAITSVGNLTIASTGILEEGNYALFDYAAQYKLSVNSDATGSWEITVGTKTDDKGTVTTLPATTYVTDFSDTLPFTNAVTSNSDADNYDYTKTTVWFAVVWEPRALDDTVVIDYGLPVDVHVLTNDFFGDFGTLIGVTADSITEDGDVTTNKVTDTSDTSSFGHVEVIKPDTGANHTNSVIRYTPSNMEMKDVDVFTYSVDYTNTKLHTNNGFYYGTLTIIPATTIYYEDEFVDLSSYTWDYNGSPQGWVIRTESGWSVVEDESYVEGEDITQAEDRPDDINFAFDTVIDANNVYGYDGAYDECSQYSLGSAVMAHVDYDNYAQAEFSFYGTGFDVISLTSNQTGAIYVEVDDVDGNRVRDIAVDTYYGMTADGELVKNDPTALYQVPVIEISGLTYGKYTVRIKAMYSEIFDHEQYADDPDNPNSYDFYLDAIRIYDPAGTPENETIEDAYKADEEGWPIYEEVRDNVITAAELEGSAELPGIVFIDSTDKTASVADYTDIGPNNELYLAANQAIAFSLDLEGYSVASVHLGIKSATGATVSYKVFNGTDDLNKDAIAALPASTIETATGMYYDITSLKDGVIVIYNSGTGMLSVTDIKITFTENPGIIENLFYISADSIDKLVENMDKPAVNVPSTFTVMAPDEVVVGSKITVKVTTSADVEAVSIDGTMVTEYSVDSAGNRVWTAKVSASEEGTKYIVVNTYNSDGYQSDTKTATVKINSAEKTVETIIRTISNLFKNWFGW